MSGPDARDGVERAVADAQERLRAAVHAAFDPDAGLAAVKAAAAHRDVDRAVDAADDQLLEVVRTAHDADAGLAAVKAAAQRRGPAEADPRR